MCWLQTTKRRYGVVKLIIVKTDPKYWQDVRARQKATNSRVGVVASPVAGNQAAATSTPVCAGCKKPRVNIDPNTKMCTICTAMGAPKN